MQLRSPHSIERQAWHASAAPHLAAVALPVAQPGDHRHLLGPRLLRCRRGRRRLRRRLLLGGRRGRVGNGVCRLGQVVGNLEGRVREAAARQVAVAAHPLTAGAGLAAHAAGGRGGSRAHPHVRGRATECGQHGAKNSRQAVCSPGLPPSSSKQPLASCPIAARQGGGGVEQAGQSLHSQQAFIACPLPHASCPSCCSRRSSACTHLERGTAAALPVAAPRHDGRVLLGARTHNRHGCCLRGCSAVGGRRGGRGRRRRGRRRGQTGRGDRRLVATRSPASFSATQGREGGLGRVLGRGAWWQRAAGGSKSSLRAPEHNAARAACRVAAGEAGEPQPGRSRPSSAHPSLPERAAAL